MPPTSSSSVTGTQTTIEVNTGEIHLGYESGRLERGNTDHLTIPSADLGRLVSITIHNEGGLTDGWHLASIRVSSARYLGVREHRAEYIATFNDWIKAGDTRTLALARDEGRPPEPGKPVVN